MPTLTITKTYDTAQVLNESDLDNLKDDIETFINVTKLDSDNLQLDAITAGLTATQADNIAGNMTQTGANSIFDAGNVWTSFTPTIAISSGGGTLVGSTVVVARQLRWRNIVWIEMNATSIEISGSPSILQITLPVATAADVKRPIWTQDAGTSTIGRSNATAASATLVIGVGISGGTFSVNSPSTNHEFSLSFFYEV